MGTSHHLQIVLVLGLGVALASVSHDRAAAPWRAASLGSNRLPYLATAVVCTWHLRPLRMLFTAALAWYIPMRRAQSGNRGEDGAMPLATVEFLALLLINYSFLSRDWRVFFRQSSCLSRTQRYTRLRPCIYWCIRHSDWLYRETVWNAGIVFMEAKQPDTLAERQWQ